MGEASAAGSTASAKVCAVAQRVEGLAGEGVGGGDELVGRVVGLAGGGGHVPAVHEPVEDDEAGEGLAGHLAERGGDRLVERARRA